MTITLYGGPQTRASMPRWYMEEMGIPYELMELSLADGQHLKEDFLAINPFGKLPLVLPFQALQLQQHYSKLFEFRWIHHEYSTLYGIDVERYNLKPYFRILAFLGTIGHL